MTIVIKRRGLPMFSQTIKILMLTPMLLVLIGCGGSEVSQSSNNITSDVNANDLLNESGDEQVIEMSELVASDDFTFSSKQTVNVSLELNDLLIERDQEDTRAYISIYREFQQLETGEYFPDSSTRVLGGQLNNALFNQKFTETDLQSEYLVEVWFYNGEAPIQQLLVLEGNELTL